MRRAAQVLICLLTISLFSGFFASPVLAAASLYLSPASSTVSQGGSFSVGVRVNTGGAKVNAVQAYLSYPADKLDFVSVAGGGSFSIQAENSGGGGAVKIVRGVDPAVGSVSGDNLVATVTFRARLSSGSAAVSFTSASKVVSTSNKNILSGKSGGTYSFRAAPKPDKTAPKISKIKVTSIGLNTATISWVTNEASNSVVDYGPSKKLGLTSSSSKLVKSHKVVLSSKLLFPGTQYYYIVRSADASGNSAKSKLTSFRTKGYLVSLKVLDTSGQPLAGVKVTIYPGLEEATTDKNGSVVFKNLAPGIHAVNVEVDGQVFGSQITVEETKTPSKSQSINVKVAGAATKEGVGKDLMQYITFLIPYIIIVLALVLGGGLIWWSRKKGIKWPGGGSSDKNKENDKGPFKSVPPSETDSLSSPPDLSPKAPEKPKGPSGGGTASSGGKVDAIHA